MMAETDINDELRTLAQDAENARLYSSPPDAIVMRAIGLGMGTRSELRRATGFAYDVIEKVLERNAADLSFQTVGQIERFYLPADAPKPKVEYICVDCGGPRSYGSGQRCKKCYDAKAKANQRPPKPELDAHDRAHQEAASRNGGSGKPSSELTKEGFTEALQKVSARAPRNFEVFKGTPADPRQGPTYKALDLKEVEELMATHETVAEAAEKLGLTTSQLYVRRQKDEAVSEAVERGRRRYYDGLDLNVDEDDDDSQESAKNITQTITKEACGCGRPATHMGRCAFRRAKAGGDFPAKKAAKNGQDAVKIKTKPRTEIEQPAPVEIVEPDKKQDKVEVRFGAFCERNCDPPSVGHHMNCDYWKQDKMIPAQRTTSTEIYGGVKLQQDIQVCAQEIAQWPKDEIAALIGELARVADISLQKPMPKTIKRAWSLDFEGPGGNDPEGTSGLTMLYLVSMLHDGMEDHEKQAVWTLIQYLKRMSAALEADS